MPNSLEISTGKRLLKSSERCVFRSFPEAGLQREQATGETTCPKLRKTQKVVGKVSYEVKESNSVRSQEKSIESIDLED